MKRKNLVILAVTAALVSACGGSETLHNFENTSNGPDAFTVMSSKPLTLPASLSALPTPTPGASNRADVAPKQELVAALGGRTQGAGIPSADRAMLSHVQRHGVTPEIRAELFAADATFRKRRGRLPGRGTGKYFAAYARYALDAYAELKRFRAAGVQTPTAPPQ